MDDVVARCPDCGNEQAEAFDHCFVCMKPSRWWCRACNEWRPTRGCAACGGGLAVPDELSLGSGVVGSTVAFRVVVRNSSKKMVGGTVSSPDAGVAIDAPRLLAAPSGTVEVRGRVTVVPGPLGPRTFRLHFAGPVPAETVLTVEAVAAAPRLEFVPPLVVLRSLNPGSTVRSTVALKNAGNVPLTATVSSAEAWLVVDGAPVALAPGESAELKLRAKSKKTDSGSREAQLIATAPGWSCVAMVRSTLPDPELTADPVTFGELTPGRSAHGELIVRNTGRVRVDCTVAAADPWLRVLPTRVNLPPGRQKKLRVRATLTVDQDGLQRSEILVAHPAGVLLRVPVTATGKVPKPLLRPIRKQRVRGAAGEAVERKFQLANDGAGRLDVSASADKPWVRIVTAELRVGPGKKRKLRYVLALPTLPRGEHTATITLATNVGAIEVPVTVHVLDPNPLLEVADAPALGLVTPDLPLSAFVRVRNAGVGLLTVRAESEDTRVTVSPDEADVPAGPPVRFNLTIPVDGLPGGEHEAAVRLTSNGGSGRAVVRFKLPIEALDVPTLIDLGDRPAGRLTGDALRVKNTGPHPASLRVRGGHQWVRPGAERITVQPGELVSIPFRMDLPPDLLGPVVSTIVLEGRAVRHTVAVRVVARKVDLIVMPGVVLLGDLTPGAERAFTVDVVNAGEIAAEVRELHTPGELEVWVRRATVPPGERVTLAGRVRVNVRQTDRQVRALVPLTDDAAVRCVAQVVPPLMPKVLAVTAAAGGLLAGGALALSVGWWIGAPLALLGLVTGVWLFWRQMG
jgi:hypothetical protein